MPGRYRFFSIKFHCYSHCYSLNSLLEAIFVTSSHFFTSEETLLYLLLCKKINIKPHFNNLFLRWRSDLNLFVYVRLRKESESIYTPTSAIERWAFFQEINWRYDLSGWSQVSRLVKIKYIYKKDARSNPVGYKVGDFNISFSMPFQSKPI